MWHLSLPWWGFIVRAVIVYLFLILALRISGKRQIGQLAPFDLILLLVLSNAVQNSMNGGDNSLLGGLISAITLIILNYATGYIAYRNKSLEKLIDGTPLVLIHNGMLFTDVMEKEKISHNELNAALREGGCSSIDEVHFAILENNGRISIKQKNVN